jgi:hypothetical protein
MKLYYSFGMAAFGCAFVALGGSPALAANPVVGSAVALEFTPTMTIEPRCGFAASGTPASGVNLGSLDTAGLRDVAFGLDCNTPFTFSTSSQNGALKRDNPMSGLPIQFSQTIDYRVRLALGVRDLDGSLRTMTETCTATALLPSGSCAFAGTLPLQGLLSGDGIAIATDLALPPSSLRITWSNPNSGDPTRVAGSYSDVLTVSVEAKS